jgi:hypothetical protein
MKKTVLILTTLFITLIGFSQTFTDGYFTFGVLGPGQVSLNDYDMAGGPSVDIPATVNYDGTTYNVTFIGYQAFMSKELTSVIIPEGVTNIVNAAFLFNSLSTVVIPNSVTWISEAAFGSNELTSITIGENVTTISANAFNGNQLTSFTLPPGVTTITKQVFANNNFTDVVIPNHITAIEEGAFQGNPLTSVTSMCLTPPDIFTGAGIVDSFEEDRSDIDLIIPPGTTGPYVTDPGAQWTGFKSVAETAFANTVAINLIGEINVFPNPANNQFTIESEDGIKTLSILNSNGAVIQTVNNPTKTIDISNLPLGVYFLQIQTEKGLLNKKLIKG